MSKRYSAMLTRFIPALTACLLGTTSVAQAASYKMLYAFQSGADGQFPVGRLAQLGTDLYGATVAGGNPCNCGTIYRLKANGAERVIYTFAGAPNDGANPEGGLAVLGTELYGTTSEGGENNCQFSQCGTVFRIGPDGGEKVIHNFQSSEASSPLADLVAVGNALWGTSPQAQNGDGAVFKTQKSGITTTYDLSNGANGYNPESGLLKVGGAFYGTTIDGGVECRFEITCGAVYKMTPAGQFSGLYAFQGGADGSTPASTLIYRHGLLFGTTSGDLGGGNGTIFALTLAGNETVLHAFAGGTDGAAPWAGLIEWNGTFYGTTSAGGGTGCGGNGCGTIFSIKPNGSYKVLYSFQGGSDGQSPQSQMIVWNGVLYGTTIFGGGGACTNGDATGCGTVFRLKP